MIGMEPESVPLSQSDDIRKTRRRLLFWLCICHHGALQDDAERYAQKVVELLHWVHFDIEKFKISWERDIVHRASARKLNSNATKPRICERAGGNRSETERRSNSIYWKKVFSVLKGQTKLFRRKEKMQLWTREEKGMLHPKNTNFSALWNESIVRRCF